jgi:hypothetical protein
MIADTSLAALLAGTELPVDSAPELRPLAGALAELRGQPASDELEGEAEALAAFQSRFPPPRMAHRPPARIPPPRRRLLPVKAAAAAATVLSLGGIATAAYARALPTAVQRLAHDIIGAPSPDTQPAITPSSAGSATTGDPAYGLCTAWKRAKAHGTAGQRAVAFSRLAAAAGGAGHVTAYCAAAAPPGMSPSQPPQPAPTPHGTSRPPGLPAPRASGKPTGLPGPYRTGAPTVRPTPHSTGESSGLPTPHSSAH